MSRADVCTPDYHLALKTSRELFEASTERLPHHTHAEAVQDGLLYRNCPRCLSTLTLEVEPEARVCLPGVSAAEAVEWLRSLVGQQAPAALDRITDFDDVEPATRLDRVSWMVSDQMIAADRAQREAAFAVPLDEAAAL